MEILTSEIPGNLAEKRALPPIPKVTDVKMGTFSFKLSQLTEKVSGMVGKLKEISMKGKSEGVSQEIFDYAKQVALIVVGKFPRNFLEISVKIWRKDLLKMVQQFVGKEISDVKKSYLIECSKNLRTSVLQFIEVTKSFYNNPYDLLTKNKLETKRWFQVEISSSWNIFQVE